MLGAGQADRFLAQPQQYLAHAMQFGELLEDQRDRLADAQIRILLEPIPGAAHVTDGHRGMQISPGGLELERFQGTLAQHRQFHLRERPLHAQQ